MLIRYACTAMPIADAIRTRRRSLHRPHVVLFAFAILTTFAPWPETMNGRWSEPGART